MKAIKWGAIGMSVLTAYTVVALLTYRLHENIFPGDGGHGAPGDCTCGSEALGVLWPIGLPITAAFYLVRDAPDHPREEGRKDGE